MADNTELGRDAEILAEIRAIVAEFERSEHGQKRALAAFNAILEVLAASPEQEGDHA